VTAVDPAGGLAGSVGPLQDSYDVALLDLDGVVYVGDDAVPHAVEALLAAERAGMRPAYVTNNALRTPEEVAAHLRRLGLPAAAGDVVTSAQAAARLLAERLPAGARVLVAGGEGLRVALRDRGLVPVEGAGEGPVAVVTGHDPGQTWTRLAEAAVALGRGARWVAANTDASIPSPRGPLPGAGAIVAMLAAATGLAPEAVAGKPHPALHHESIERTGARHPLVVGDRLDTDIEGAVRGGAASLLVLTGVSDAEQVLRAPVHQRPTHLAGDLRGLAQAHPAPSAEGGAVTVGSARARVDDHVLVVTGDGAMDRLRAACALSWRRADAGDETLPVRGL